MVVISWWIWSRSNGVMKVLCSSAMVSCVILSAARSTSSMRCAWASSSVKVPIIAASSRPPSTMRSAWALNRSKNLPSRGIRRPSIGLLLGSEAAAIFSFYYRFVVETPVRQRLRAALAALGRRTPHRRRACARSAAPAPAARPRHVDVNCFGQRCAASRRASDHDSTGAKQASEPSKTLHPFARVFDLKGLLEQRLHLRPARAVVLAEVLQLRASAAVPDRSASRSSRSTRTCRPWFRTRCTRARRCRGCCRREFH